MQSQRLIATSSSRPTTPLETQCPCSLCLFPNICLSMSLSVSFSVCLCLSLSVWLCLSGSVSLSQPLSVCLFVFFVLSLSHFVNLTDRCATYTIKVSFPWSCRNR